MKIKYIIICVFLVFLLNVVSVFSNGNKNMSEGKMNPYIPLYSWLQGDTVIISGRIKKIRKIQLDESKEKVTVEVHIEDKIWGNIELSDSEYDFIQSESEIARLKFPHPIWGDITIEQGILLFIVNPGDLSQKLEPKYVGETGIHEINTIKAIVQTYTDKDTQDRGLHQYLIWLKNGNSFEKLFSAETLSRDFSTESLKTKKEITIALTNGFLLEADKRIKFSICISMWERLYQQLDENGKIIIINTTFRILKELDDSNKIYCIDKIVTEIEPELLKNKNIKADNFVVNTIKERLKIESDSDIKRHVQSLIDNLILE